MNAVDGDEKSLLDNYRRMLYKECMRSTYLTMRWIYIYCNKIMDTTNFTQFVIESDNDKTSNQQAVVEYHGWHLLPD